MKYNIVKQYKYKLVITLLYIFTTLQLQEMKAKTNMEGKYIKKCAEVSVAQTQKRCNMQENELKDEIEVCYLQLLL